MMEKQNPTRLFNSSLFKPVDPVEIKDPNMMHLFEKENTPEPTPTPSQGKHTRTTEYVCHSGKHTKTQQHTDT